MTQEMIDKRNTLRTISKAAIEAAQELNIDTDSYKVNDLIMLFAYNPKNEHTFNTFVGWKLKGHTVNKGAKAYLLWGQPINRERKNNKGESNNHDEDSSEAPFFPLAYLFREDQTTKIEPRQPRSDKDKEPTNTQHTSIDINI